MTVIIELSGLGKSFGPIAAVADVSALLDELRSESLVSEA